GHLCEVPLASLMALQPWKVLLCGNRRWSCYRNPDVCRLFGNINPSTLYRGIRVGRYPKPVRVGPNSSRWLLAECQAALRAMVEQRPYSDPIEYAKKKREAAERLDVSEAIVEEAVKRIRAERKEQEQSQATRLMAIGFGEGVKLWHSLDGQGHASVLVDGHWEHYRIRSNAFDGWLRGEYGRINRVKVGNRWVPQVPGTQAVRDAMASLDGYAQHQGEPQEVWMRVGGDEEVIWIDLGRSDWSGVKVTRNGWQVVKRMDVAFVRGGTMLPLPIPRRGGN